MEQLTSPSKYDGLHSLERLKQELQQLQNGKLTSKQGNKFAIIENELKALEIIKKHLSLVVPINDVIEIFDIDLWNDGKQKEDFEFVRKVLEL